MWRPAPRLALLSPQSLYREWSTEFFKVPGFHIGRKVARCLTLSTQEVTYMERARNYSMFQDLYIRRFLWGRRGCIANYRLIPRVIFWGRGGVPKDTKHVEIQVPPFEQRKRSDATGSYKEFMEPNQTRCKFWRKNSTPLWWGRTSRNVQEKNYKPFE